ncbi:MAG: DUF4843 domain-containing protein [Candidatus Pseudobacter hemicellulosilyticus]|uniref:DUF4843 domain-containing protein n=1 Tax=Candidatus Pseudobacter hemicellulosilyticus TaxID=3121375 RepID=A0AAJ5WQJ4_9BACT|nr:MAG: DUF4843 domain-containing protein [Pseudobacter sp.]
MKHNPISICKQGGKKLLVAALLLTSGMLLSCQKEKLPPPSYQNGVWFYKAYTGSTTSNTDQDLITAFSQQYSFYLNGDITRDTIWLPEVRAMGQPADRTRRINLVKVDSNTTAIEGTHYILLNEGMPAGEISTRLGVVLLRTTDQQTKTFTLGLSLQPSDDFPAQLARDTVSTDRTFFLSTHYTIRFDDQLIQPPYWKDLQIYYGSWSKAKMTFIYSVIGIYPGLVPVTADDAEMHFMNYLKVRSALDSYNKANPTNPLKDDNGYQIYF